MFNLCPLISGYVVVTMCKWCQVLEEPMRSFSSELIDCLYRIFFFLVCSLIFAAVVSVNLLWYFNFCVQYSTTVHQVDGNILDICMGRV